MTAKVFALDTKPGIQRDGTIFDQNFYTDGLWVRWQRGRPRKIAGYRQIVYNLTGPSRGIYVNPQQNYTNVFNGHSAGLQVLPVNDAGIGAGLLDFTLSDFTSSALNMWQFDTITDAAGSGNNLLLAHPGQNLALLDNNTNTPVLQGSITGTTMSKIGVFTVAGITKLSGVNTITLPAAEARIGAGQVISGNGIPSGTTVVSVVSTTVTISANTTNANTFTGTFDNEIEVSGGVVSLHPYVFVFGNNGLIKNSAAGDPTDWQSADANEVNVATGKIVQGLPVRGGSNSPSGLFWSLDSLIRVSFIGGTGTPVQYWRYDIISSQSSIMSSQCVIEYDGIYYWIGVDRFLMYNGVVKEIPNNMCQNWFFDNLNYEQRQKVWVTKVPRFGEVWWFYPRGNATECTDAIIYNIREQTWYDAGSAQGAQRSAGYFSQVFHYPVMADWNVNYSGGIATGGIYSAGSSYTNGTYTFITLTDGANATANATIVVAGGVVTSVTITDPGSSYSVGNLLTIDPTTPIAGGSGFQFEVLTINDYVSLWQHEFGTDAVQLGVSLAIPSYFMTNDLGWVGGGPSEPAMVGTNKWLRLERVEPDFILSGEMELYVTGRPYAQEADATTGPYIFDATTGKIDMKEQRRELRLRFVSNVVGGNYETGRILLNGEFGDVRGY